MSSDPDDDALSWDGDEARRDATPPPRRKDTEPAPAQVEWKSDLTPPITKPAPVAVAPHEGVGTVTLVLLGLLGGIYLLYTIGWAIGGIGMQTRAMFMIPAPMYVATMWLAVLAPAIWFVTSLVLTRRSKDWVRLTALIVGALLLVPWPFVMAGGGGAL